MEQERSHLSTRFFLALFCVVGFVVLTRTDFGGTLERFLVGTPEASHEEHDALVREVAFLKSKEITGCTVVNASKFIDAFVYSFYPNGFKSHLVINRGVEDGVAVGDAVLVDTIFFGHVIEVEGTTAIVQTIFDTAERLAVRIGKNQVDALLLGGTHPHLTLIPKNASVKIGDVVVTAGQEFLYGLPIATISSLQPSVHDVLGEAELVFSYYPNTLRAVRVLRISR